jgi:gamma-glutamylcyclotransferase (GGCT)/AIG2-like uncharacterized protein YtfP
MINVPNPTNGQVASGDLFVFYGLLKQGAAGMPKEIDLEAAGRFGAPCRFKGTMVDLGGFPGVVNGETLCHGIRYVIDDPSIVPALDAFEDTSPDDPAHALYERRRIPLFTDQGKPAGETAWIYWYKRDVTGVPVLSDGNWPLQAGRMRK